MNSELPKVSIVIPVFNGADYVKEAIDSALDQTYSNIEVIVVNDGSEDHGKTEKIALSYGNKIRYFYKKNGGVASALNRGLKEMKGDYFSWLSHDDVYLPHKIEEQIKLMQSSESKDIVIYSDSQLIDANSKPYYDVHLEKIHPNKLTSALLLNRFINGCSLLIPKKCFSNGMRFDKKLKTTQDYDLWFKMIDQYNFVHLDKILIQSRQHPEQGTRTLRGIHKKECSALFSDNIDRLLEKDDTHFVILPKWIYFARLSYSYLRSGLFKASGKALMAGFKTLSKKVK